MTASAAQVTAPSRPPERVRVVTAASLFDGHDAAINIMRRILQAQGAEVIHLGHDRSVEEIAMAAVQEDAHAVAVSSYQGGHMEFFRFLVDRLRELRRAEHPRLRRRRRHHHRGGGRGAARLRGGAHLQARGRPRAGARGHDPAASSTSARGGPSSGVTDEVVAPVAGGPAGRGPAHHLARGRGRRREGRAASACARQLAERRTRPRAPVIGFTGTGGSGKSSVVDELVRRFRREFPERSVGLLLVDPTRRRSGRRAARRPHPHERDLRAGDLRALAGDAPGASRALARRGRRGARAPGGGLRPHPRRDGGHRPERLGDRRPGRHLRLRDDARVRRALPAREDRHARPGRPRRAQQERPPGGRGRAARRAQAVAAQPRQRALAADDEIPVFPTVASQWNDPAMDRLLRRAARPRASRAGAQSAAPVRGFAAAGSARR